MYFSFKRLDHLEKLNKRDTGPLCIFLELLLWIYRFYGKIESLIKKKYIINHIIFVIIISFWT